MPEHQKLSNETAILDQQIVNCRHCPRLRSYRDKNAHKFPDYWNQPVPASGVHSRLTIVGLAPGLHGANKTGIPFTGDASGDLLFKCLDTLGLREKVRITNVVKCAPPQNAPLASERQNCRKFLAKELSHKVAVQHALSDSTADNYVLFCLGRVAHEETLRALDRRPSSFEFGHANVHQLQDKLWLVDSYHCSRYNIQTNRLTEPMFLSALQCARKLAQYQ